MLTYQCWGGQLGNLVLIIYNLFLYCKKNKINFNNLKFPINYVAWRRSSPMLDKTYGLKVTNIIKDNIVFFNKIKYIFVDDLEYNAIKANFKETIFSLDSTIKDGIFTESS